MKNMIYILDIRYLQENLYNQKFFKYIKIKFINFSSKLLEISKF